LGVYKYVRIEYDINVERYNPDSIIHDIANMIKERKV
jgi:hypothetical protein